jgi:hypothetical protein
VQQAWVVLICFYGVFSRHFGFATQYDPAPYVDESWYLCPSPFTYFWALQI